MYRLWAAIYNLIKTCTFIRFMGRGVVEPILYIQTVWSFTSIQTLGEKIQNPCLGFPSMQ